MGWLIARWGRTWPCVFDSVPINFQYDCCLGDWGAEHGSGSVVTSLYFVVWLLRMVAAGRGMGGKLVVAGEGGWRP